MAFETGTATNFEDLFGRIVAFVSTNAALVAANQQWAVLRQHRDNIAALTSPLVPQTGGGERRNILHTCRYDARTLGVDDPLSPNAAAVTCGSLALGTSFVRWQLRTAEEIATVRLRAPPVVALDTMIRSWRLQWSNDGVSWTTALTVTNPPAFVAGEWRDFAVGGSPGVRLHWQIIVDSVQNGSTITVSWSSMLLLRADGSVANHFGSEVLLEGPGTSGTDEIFVGIRSEYNAVAGWYNLFLNGYTGHNPSEQSWLSQPGGLPQFGQNPAFGQAMVPCWDQPMPYWIAANGRSIRFAIKVSTVYEAGYLGFFVPYSTPGQYPYPLCVGGSLIPQLTARTSDWRFSLIDHRHSCFPMPGGTTNQDDLTSTFYLRDTSGQWRSFRNRPDSSSGPNSVAGINAGQGASFNPIGTSRGMWPHCVYDQWTTGKRPFRECSGGGYLFHPVIPIQRLPTFEVYGELDGVYIVSGFDNAAENTATFNGDEHVVIANAFRTIPSEHFALRLEG